MSKNFPKLTRGISVSMLIGKNPQTPSRIYIRKNMYLGIIFKLLKSKNKKKNLSGQKKPGKI